MMKRKVLSILLVEDQPGDIQLVQEYLRDFKETDVRLTTVNDLSEIAAVLKMTVIDAVLLDLGLPGSSGIESLVRLRAMAPHLPVIVLTGLNDSEMAQRSIKKGAQDYLAKDELDSLPLERIICSAIERHRLHLALETRLESRSIEQNFTALIMKTTREGALVVDTEGIVEYANHAAGQLLNRRIDELVGAEFGFPISDECLLEVPPRRSGESPVYLEMRVTEPTDVPSQMKVITLHDITHHERTRAQLLHTAHHDTLTGIETREMFNKRLSRLIDKAQRKQLDTFVVMYVDCDNFKQVNDSFGHDVGDALLQRIAEVMLTTVRPSDFIGRLGGDEFAIGLEDLSSISDAINVADRIIEAVGTSQTIMGHQITTSVSIGMAAYRPGHNETKDILRDADTALQSAKKRGKGRHEVFDDSMSADRTLNEYFGSELSAAIGLNQLDILLQPVISVHNRGVVAMEAFLRWYRPNGSVLYPSHFMEMVRTKGLSRDIDLWVLSRTASMYAEDTTAGSQVPAIGLNINICSATLLNCEFMRKLSRSTQPLLSRCPLTFEISEQEADNINHRNPELWKQLNELDIKVHLDNFDAGRSSIALIAETVVSEISLSPQLTKSLLVDKKARRMVQSIIHAAHDLEKLVVAEGVETAEQLNVLTDLGCDLIQGHLISKPLDAQGIVHFLAENNPWLEHRPKFDKNAVLV